MAKHIPSGITVHAKSRTLELSYSNGEMFQLPVEYLRVYSPSAEVKGHGPGQEVLQTGKKNVGIKGIESVGNYALQFTFDDGHDTGIYPWDYLYELATTYEAKWQDYLARLTKAGASRDPELQVLHFQP